MPLFIQALGLILFLREHPYWNPKFKKSFGPAGLATVACFQAVTLLALLIWEPLDTAWLYPLWGWLAFVLGTVAAMFSCYEIQIVRLALKRRIMLSRNWVIAQVTGIALVSASFWLTRYLGHSSVADGFPLYVLVVGAGLILATTKNYWEEIQEAEPNQAAQTTPDCSKGVTVQKGSGHFNPDRYTL